MKHVILLVFFTLLLSCSYAQDQIVKLNGDEVPARVLEITLVEVLYQHPDSLEGTTRRIAKADVFMIKFANGTKEVFQSSLAAVTEPEELSPEEMYQRGRQDAQQYFHGSGALWGAAASSLYPVAGLVGPIVIAAIRPKAHKSPVPDPTLLSNPNYVRGYESKAHSKKAKKALAGAGIGSVVSFVGILIIASSWGGYH